MVPGQSADDPPLPPRRERPEIRAPDCCGLSHDGNSWVSVRAELGPKLNRYTDRVSAVQMPSPGVGGLLGILLIENENNRHSSVRQKSLLLERSLLSVI